MTESLKVVEIKTGNLGDIPNGLRRLADQVERGDYGDVHNLAWSIDCGSGRIEIGMLRKAPEAGVTAYYLFALSMRKLE